MPLPLHPSEAQEEEFKTAECEFYQAQKVEIKPLTQSFELEEGNVIDDFEENIVETKADLGNMKANIIRLQQT